LNHSTSPDTDPKLSAAELQSGLGTRIIGREIHVYDLVISTNDVAWELAGRGARDGTVVLAEEQTQGRGRLGRTWWSPRGRGIWMSVLLHPPTPEGAVPMVTIVGALATADAIRETTRLPAMIRWPNDIMIEGRKAAGILVESHRGPRGHEVVLGIGLDVDAAGAEMPEDIADLATSLSEALGERVDRVALARQLLTDLDRWYQVKLDRDIGRINQHWRELSATLGHRIVLEENGRRYEGEVADLDVVDGLALRLGRGNIRHFRGEHVSVIEHSVE
jgi:BirA family transcriptional regulator, biotin operon repressor / biotin---[acetyl-CoA-carboxylase] ligase